MSLYQFFSMFHENSIAIPSAASSGDTGPEHAASHFKTTADRPKRDRAKQEDDLSNTRDPDPEVLLHPAVDHEKAGDRHKQNVRPKHDDDRKKTRRVKVPKREACRSLTTLEKLYHDRLSGTTCVDVIVPGGDLILECGPSRTKIEGRVQVASQMLWIVSPVFAALLGPESQRPEAEAVRRANIRGNEPAVVFLQGEFLGAFLWFLGIVFHQRYRDPTSFTWCDLAGVAAVANAYDVAEFLYPWVHKQTENLWESWDDECDTQDLIDQFHVAWTFKHEEIFTTVGNRLALSLSDISDPSLSYSQNFLIDKVIQNVMSRRLRIIHLKFSLISAVNTKKIKCTGIDGLHLRHCAAPFQLDDAQRRQCVAFQRADARQLIEQMNSISEGDSYSLAEIANCIYDYQPKCLNTNKETVVPHPVGRALTLNIRCKVCLSMLQMDIRSLHTGVCSVCSAIHINCSLILGLGARRKAEDVYYDHPNFKFADFPRDLAPQHTFTSD